MSHLYRTAATGNSETLLNMEEDDIFGRDLNKTAERKEVTAPDGLHKGTQSSYRGQSGPVQYQIQTTIPLLSSGLYMPQNHGGPESYQQQQSAIPYNQIFCPQMLGAYAGGPSFVSMGTSFESASNSESVYNEVNHDQSDNIY
jgi:hypothetical protein